MGKLGATMLMKSIQRCLRSCHQISRKNFVAGCDLWSSIIQLSVAVLLPIFYRQKVQASKVCIDLLIAVVFFCKLLKYKITSNTLGNWSKEFGGIQRQVKTSFRSHNYDTLSLLVIFLLVLNVLMHVSLWIYSLIDLKSSLYSN